LEAEAAADKLSKMFVTQKPVILYIGAKNL
jgi:hypothetical protein